jgi:glycosyltransferase involved in cell wall biosynthesis
MPRINIIMPVYNQEKYIVQSIRSILDQTFKDFALLLINDGSTDATVDVVERNFSDERIKIIHNDQNRGLIYSLNKGLKLAADAEFISRMDGDDIAFPQRFEKQIAFMEKHPAVGILGTNIQLYKDNKVTKTVRYPATHDKIVASMLCVNALAHPTLLIRSSLFKDGDKYSEEFPKFEDYALWIALIGKTEFANLDEVLLYYRIHDKSVSASYGKEMDATHRMVSKIIRLYANHIPVLLSNEEVDVLTHILIRYNGRIALSDIEKVLSGIVHKLEGKTDIIYAKKLLAKYVLRYFLSFKRYKDAFLMFSKPYVNALSFDVMRSMVQKNPFPI